jgi:hypothetical protein
MTTAVIRNWRLAHPESEIVVVSGYPEVFLHNPDVSRNFTFNHPYLWADYYSDPDYKIYAQDVYLTQDWIQNKRKHFIEIFCDELGIDFIQQRPLLYFSAAEVDELKNMVKVDKPLLVVQSTRLAAAAGWFVTQHGPGITRNATVSLVNAYHSRFATEPGAGDDNAHKPVDAFPLMLAYTGDVVTDSYLCSRGKRADSRLTHPLMRELKRGAIVR